MQKPSPKIISVFILIVAVIILIAYHAFAYIGHYGYDDLEYARLAAGFLKGNPDFTNHFSFRFSLVVPTAVAYAVCGISDFSSALPAMLATVAILLVVYFILRKKGPVQLSLGLMFTLLSHWFIFYSDKLMPDIFVALAVVLAVYAIYQFRYNSNGQHPLRYALYLSGALLLGLMAKGTILLIIPWLFYLFVVDRIARKNSRFWIFTLISGLGFLVVYFIGLYVLTGNVTSRFDALSANAYLNSCSYDSQSLSILLERLSTGFLKMGIQSGLFAPYIFVFGGFFNRRFLSHFRLNDADSYFSVTALILLFSANFMTISPSAYVPMCLDIRHYLFLIPVAAIPASKVIFNFMESGKNRFGILVFILSAAVYAYFTDYDIFQKLYLPLAILFLAFVFFKLQPKFQWIFVLILVYILGNKPYGMISYADQIGYRFQRKFVFSTILDNPEPAYILTNPVQKRLGAYYGQFKDTSHVFLNYDNFDADTLDGRRRFVLRNWYTAYLSGMNSSSIPVYIQQIDSTHLIASDSEYKLELLDAAALQNPRLERNLLLKSANGFESPQQYWHADASRRIENPVYNGDYAENVGEYSGTFVLPFDSLVVPKGIGLYIICTAHTRFEKKTTAALIASIEDSTGVLLRKAVEANSFQKAFSNWWPVKMEFDIKPEQLQPNSTLKAYLWNPDKTPAFIDDFTVEIYAYPGVN